MIRLKKGVFAWEKTKKIILQDQKYIYIFEIEYICYWKLFDKISNNF